MRRMFFKLAMALVFFAGSLAADVPGGRKSVEPCLSGFTIASAAGGNKWPALDLIGRQALADATDPLEAVLGFSVAQVPIVTAGLPLPPAASPEKPSLVPPDSAGQADMAAVISRLKEIFEKEGVPQKWVWIAEVESGFDPQAESPAGAAGLFQLMPATAERFGLNIAPYDDRLMPEKSASAAAQYLKHLRKEFGSWSLALAAYNAGEGRLKRIMNDYGARTFEDVSRYLPAETRDYVPRVLAIVAQREDQSSRLSGIPGAF
ncbi:MAG: lytic transglycosylase domain-containing protein [Lentisphaerae bacterium]|nr:lytic transglycosylase domain-containing protein [Lentisphaerota bacterium]